MHLLQMGVREEIMASRTIWLCAACGIYAISDMHLF
jgi:hypothetical protein